MTTDVRTQMDELNRRVRAELPLLAQEMLTLSAQGQLDHGRFRELASELTLLPGDQRLSIVRAAIAHAAIEAAAAKA